MYIHDINQTGGIINTDELVWHLEFHHQQGGLKVRHRGRPEKAASELNSDLNNGTIKQKRHKVKSTSSHKKVSGVGTGLGRGRPRKVGMPMYHSQISGDKNAIKIRIKKSNLAPQVSMFYNDIQERIL